jgi:monothiol glutaredoxin
MSIDEQTRGRIDALVREHRILLFMKGERHAPQCGFSATVVQILNALGCDYHTVDVLADPQLREGIKAYSAWPTVPQLYVDGEFQGGCDIVRETYARGELQQMLGPSQAGARA